MPNPLFESLNNNNYNSIIAEAKRLKETFRGDPREEVQRLLNSGQMTQAQFNEFSQVAQRILGAMK